MASIGGQASRDNYYGSKEIEKAFGDVEADCAPALHKLASEGPPHRLNAHDVARVLAWLTFQRARTDANRSTMQPMHDAMLRLWLEIRANNDESLSDEVREGFKPFIDTAEADPLRGHLIAIKSALEMSHILNDLQPCVLRNATARPFIFGDAPVVFYNVARRKDVHRGVLGYDSVGLQVFFPLSPKALLMLTDAAVYRVQGIRNGELRVRELRDVAALNKLQLHAAGECVYFNDRSYSAYMTDLWKQEKKSFFSTLAQVNHAPGFNAETGEELGEIVHTFEPQLPFVLSLSFLEFRPLDPTANDSSRRRSAGF